MTVHQAIITHDRRTRKVICSFGDHSSFSFFHSSFARLFMAPNMSCYRLSILKETGGTIIENNSGHTYVEGEFTRSGGTVKFQISISTSDYNKSDIGAEVHGCFFTSISIERSISGD